MSQIPENRRLIGFIATTASIIGIIAMIYIVVTFVFSDTQPFQNVLLFGEDRPRFSFPKECTRYFGEVSYRDGERGRLPAIEWLGTEDQYFRCATTLVAHSPVEYEIGDLRDLRILLAKAPETFTGAVDSLDVPPICSKHYIETTPTHETSVAVSFSWTGTDADWDQCFQGIEPWHDWLAEPALNYNGVDIYDFYIEPVKH